MSWIFDIVDVATFWTILLIVHGLLAVALLGAVTHQAAAAWAAPRPAGGAPPGFLARFSHVRGEAYTGAVCVLWIVTFLFGGWIYTKYRIAIRIPMEQEGFWKTQGVFELKEHLATVGLLMLPFYRHLWTHDAGDAAHAAARRWTTLVLAAIVWYLFLIGHIVNNVRGYGS